MGHWVSDGSPEISVSSDGAEVICQLGDGCYGSNVYNGLWKEDELGATSGTHYWQIHVTIEDSVFVGFTDLEKFKKGWASKGLFYGGPGNLSNGSALVTGGYGPSIESGNTVGVLAVFESDRLKTYFDLNGTPLGEAFDLPSTVLNSIFPAVHFSGNGKATITKIPDIPSDLVRKEPVYEGIEGDWKCLEFNNAAPPVSVTIGIFREKDGGENYTVNLHVINQIHYVLHRHEDGIWKTSGGMSTRMGGSPELMKFEREISNLVKDLTRMENLESFLVMSTATNTSKFERYSTAKKPVTKDPFF